MSRALLARNAVAKLYLDVAGANIATNAWTELTSSLSAPVSAVEIFNSTGRVLKLAIGAAASEQELDYYILPGTVSPIIPVSIAKSSRLSLKAMDSLADSGEVVINCFG